MRETSSWISRCHLWLGPLKRALGVCLGRLLFFQPFSRGYGKCCCWKGKLRENSITAGFSFNQENVTTLGVQGRKLLAPNGRRRTTHVKNNKQNGLGKRRLWCSDPSVTQRNDSTKASKLDVSEMPNAYMGSQNCCAAYTPKLLIYCVRRYL